jgi:hypothetical protein
VLKGITGCAEGKERRPACFQYGRQALQAMLQKHVRNPNSIVPQACCCLAQQNKHYQLLVVLPLLC